LDIELGARGLLAFCVCLCVSRGYHVLSMDKLERFALIALIIQYLMVGSQTTWLPIWLSISIFRLSLAQHALL